MNNRGKEEKHAMRGKHAKENSAAVAPSGRGVAEPGVAAVPLAEPGVAADALA